MTNIKDRLEHVAPEDQATLRHSAFLKSSNVQRRSRESASPRSGGRSGGRCLSCRRNHPDKTDHELSYRDCSEEWSDPGLGYRGEPTSWYFRCCLPLDSASEVPRFRRLATGIEHQRRVRRRRAGSKRGILGAVLSTTTGENSTAR